MSHGGARVHLKITDADRDADRKENTPSCVGGKKPVEKEYSLYRYVNARAIIVMPACDVVEIYFQ